MLYIVLATCGYGNKLKLIMFGRRLFRCSRSLYQLCWNNSSKKKDMHKTMHDRLNRIVDVPPKP
jgi:hypothetical protein